MKFLAPLARGSEKRYNDFRMTAEILRLLLAATLVVMLILAMLYLHCRLLTLRQFAAWELLALFVPARGSFLVILCRPGRTPFRRFRKTQRQKSF